MRKNVYFALPIAIVLLWELAIRVANIAPFLLPPPALVFSTMITEWETLARHTWWTLEAALVGYFLANVVSLGLSIIFLYLPWFEEYMTPFTLFVKNIPFVAIATILYIWLGDGLWTKVLLVVMATFFPILANVTAGLKSSQKVLLERFYVLDASKLQIFRHVQWPEAIPYYMAAHKIAFTGSVLAAMIGEWLIAHEGLGALLINARAAYRIDLLFAVVVVSSTLSILAYFAVVAVEKWVMRWKYT